MTVWLIGGVLSFGTAWYVHDVLRNPVVQLAAARQVHITGFYSQKSGPDYDIDGTLSAGGFVGRGQEALPADTTFGLAITIGMWTGPFYGPVTFVPGERFEQVSTSEEGSFAGVNSDGKIVDLYLQGFQSGLQLKLSDYR